MKSAFLMMALTASFLTGKAQQKVDLPDYNGIKLSYQLSKIDGNDKKDQYVVVFSAVNTNEYDLYYTVPMTKQKDSTYKLNSFDNKSFCELVAKNSTGLKSFLDNRAKVAAQETPLTTRNHEVLFKISKGQTYTGDLKFNVKPDQAPVLTNEFKTAIKRLDEFDIGINGMFINGTWEMNCGGTRVNLSLTKNERGLTQLIQTVNGRQQLWQMVSENIFEKFNDRSATLTYNKTGNIFTYTNTDGVICMWNKR